MGLLLDQAHTDDGFSAEQNEAGQKKCKNAATDAAGMRMMQKQVAVRSRLAGLEIKF